MKIFGSVKQTFISVMLFFSYYLPTVKYQSFSCISMNNQPCKARPEIINISTNNPVFYLFSIRSNKCNGNCNNVNDPCVKICVPDVVKDLNVKVFNLMSRTNETRHIKWHETCKCKCRLDASVCNNKQRWNNDKCRCECKELIHKGVCDKDFIWNPSNFEFGYNKASDFSEYLDYKNCICNKRLVNKLVEECNETINGEKLTPAENENSHKCKSWTVDIVLFSILFIISVGIGAYFVYYKYVNPNKENVSKYYDYVYHP